MSLTEDSPHTWSRPAWRVVIECEQDHSTTILAAVFTWLTETRYTLPLHFSFYPYLFLYTILPRMISCILSTLPFISIIMTFPYLSYVSNPPHTSLLYPAPPTPPDPYPTEPSPSPHPTIPCCSLTSPYHTQQHASWPSVPSSTCLWQWPITCSSMPCPALFHNRSIAVLVDHRWREPTHTHTHMTFIRLSKGYLTSAEVLAYWETNFDSETSSNEYKILSWAKRDDYSKWKGN